MCMSATLVKAAVFACASVILLAECHDSQSLSDTGNLSIVIIQSLMGGICFVTLFGGIGQQGYCCKNIETWGRCVGLPVS